MSFWIRCLFLKIFFLNFDCWFLPGNPDWEPHPFDFLIDGELVRMSLEQFLLAKGISAVLRSLLNWVIFYFWFIFIVHKSFWINRRGEKKSRSHIYFALLWFSGVVWVQWYIYVLWAFIVSVLIMNKNSEGWMEEAIEANGYLRAFHFDA